MKNSIFTCTFLLIFTNICLSQCPTDLSLSYATQYDIDTFKLKYPNCTNLISISLSNSTTDPIRNLSGFSNIDSLQFDLNIYNQTELASLEGLEKLRTIGSLQISNCNKLQNLSGLDNLRQINGSLFISKINNLTSLSGLKSLESIIYDIDLNDLSALNDFQELHLLKNINNLRIRNCSSLTELSGLENIENVKASLTITDCSNLTRLSKLEKIKYIGSNFIISNNISLKEISGLNTLEYIGNNFEIKSNVNLKNIQDFNSLIKIEFGGLTISNNNVLETINGFNKLQISKNGIQVSDKSLITLKGFNDLLTAGFNFENFKSLVEISGFENLKYASIINFKSNDKLTTIPYFNNVDSVKGNISTNSCPLITEMNGFNNIKYIGGDLILYNNNSLRTIPIFNLLESVRNIEISDLPNLESINGFASLRLLDAIRITNNAKLLNLPDFNLIKTIVGSILINNNSLLKNIPSLENLISTGSYQIYNNKSIEVIHGCPNLETVASLFWIITTNNLTEISGFNKLRKTGAFAINENKILNKIPSFNSLQDIPNEYFSITDNPVLDSIIGFNQLNGGISTLKIDQNGIKIVSGFNNLTNCISIQFENNPNLTKIEGFNKLEKGNIYIKSNNLLKSIPSFNNLHYPAFIDNSTFQFEVSKNYNLKQINGFNRLQNAGTILIYENDLLEEIIGFEELVKSKDITIKGSSIHSIPSFNKLKIIGIETEDYGFTNYSGLYLEEMPKLEEISGFNNIDTLKGWLHIISNTSLRNISAFKNVKRVYRNLVIYQNDSLKSFVGLEKLNLIGGHYIIKKNNLMRELPNTKELHTIRCQYLSNYGIGLDISGDSISSLKGLQNLTQVYRYISIIKTNLTSLQGLENVDPKGLASSYIQDNPKLSSCSIYFLCEKIKEKPFSCDVVKNNATGCNNCTEVKCTDINLEGHIFYDFDKNKLLGSNEVPLNNIRILIQPDNVELLPRSNGKFIYNCEIGKNYKIIPILNNNWDLTTDSLTYNFTFQQNVDRTKKLDFGLHPNFTKHEGQINIISSPTRCNTNVPFDITYQNTGTFEETGKFIFTLDPLAIFESSDPPPTEIIGNKYVWNYQNLRPFNTNSIKAIIHMPNEQSTGSLLNIKGEMYSNTNLISDYLYTPQVICSYDPNDKIVMPSDATGKNYFTKGEELTYTIRFQNEGNADAIDISIQDTLDNNLDPSSLTVINSSHLVQTYIKENSVRFDFKNIWLPSKKIDEFSSQGFITFKISPKATADLGQIFFNNASIYFDLNSPIVTNTIQSTYALNTSNDEIKKFPIIKVYPNPSNEEINLVSDSKVDKTKICTLTGLTLEEFAENKLKIVAFPNGMYILKIFIDGNVYSKLVMIRHD